MTQPFQVLWLFGVQVAQVHVPGVHVAGVQLAGVQCAVVQVPWPQIPPLFWQGFLDVYCDLEQALVPVQLLWVVWAAFEQVPALVQVLCVL